MMSLTFIFLAIISKPNFSDLLNGLVPSVNDKNFVYVIYKKPNYIKIQNNFNDFVTKIITKINLYFNRGYN